MKRRQFLNMSAMAGLAASVPAGIREAFAAPQAQGGLFVLVQAVGGWDPRMVCDPLPSSQARLGRRARVQTATAHGIRYAALEMHPETTNLDASATPALLSARAFFESHAARFVCINGVDVGSVDHAQATARLIESQPKLRTTGAVRLSGELAESDLEHVEHPELLDLRRFERGVSTALAAHQAGLVGAVHLQLGGFDTHGSHDVTQTCQLGKLYRGIDTLLRSADARGVGDRLTLLVTSEFGRAPHYDAPGRFAGKDHWPVTSAMVLGPGIEGGRTVGSTDAGLVPRDPIALDDLFGVAMR